MESRSPMVLNLMYMAAFVLAALSAWVVTWAVREWALRRGITFTPDAERHIHQTPVPRLGGIAIYLTFTGIVASATFSCWLLNIPFNTSLLSIVTFLGAGTIVFLAGLYDDLRGLSPWWKLAAETAAALLLVAGGFEIGKIGMLFSNHQIGSAAGAVVTVAWVLLVTNAFNLIDGLDGLAAGSAFCSTIIVFLSIYFTTHINSALIFAIVLAGVILGFLRYNFNPASIFLGDSGSLFIGFVLSAIALFSFTKSSTALAVGVPVAAFGLPIVDTIVAIARRFLGGKPIFTADGQHIHHRLMKLGWSHRNAVMLLYVVTAAFGAISLLLLNPDKVQVAFLFASVALVVVLGVRYLGYMEFAEMGRIAERAITQRQIMVNNLAIRRASEELKNCNSLDGLRKVLLHAFAENDVDGFRLEFRASPEPRHLPDGFVRAENGRLYTEWFRGESVTAGWSMQLTFADSDRMSEGRLTLARSHTKQALMIDVNVLMQQLYDEVAAALVRCLRAEQGATDTSAEAVRDDLPARPHRSPS